MRQQALMRMWGKKGTFAHCWQECTVVQPLWKTLWRFLKKLKIELPHCPAISVLSAYSKGTKHMKTASSIAHNSQYREPTPVSTFREMNKENVVYLYNGIVFSLRKKRKSCHLQPHG
jgi:hypothetical protein